MLEDVKILLGISDSEKDDVLQTIVKITSSRLLVLLGVKEVPERLKYIVTEVSVARYNRIGSEGASSHSAEGESLSWSDSDSDFEPYQAEIDAFNTAQNTPQKGRVRFL